MRFKPFWYERREFWNVELKVIVVANLSCFSGFVSKNVFTVICKLE